MLIYLLFQFVVIIVLGLVLLSFSRNRYYRLGLSILISVFLLLQFSSLYMGDSLINHRYIEHFNLRDLGLTLHLFIPELLLGLGIGTGLTFGLMKVSGLIDRKKTFRLPAKIILGVACIGLLFLKDGMFRNLYEAIQFRDIEITSFREALGKLGIPQEAYVSPEALQAQPGKNIIVLSLESYERGYLEDEFAHITPNLRRLSKEMTYIPMERARGSDFTTASLYTFMTGVPMYFQGDRDEIFQQSTATQLSSLAHVLNKAGYQQSYLMGDPEFGGTDFMLNLLGVEVKSENDFDTTYTKAPWGIHDRHLFNEVKKAALRYHQSGEPFAVYASTISTHGPDGVYDAGMLEWVEPEKTHLEFMAKSVDYMIGDLVAFLEKEQILENTVFYIFPDHMLLGNTHRVSERFDDPRGLFVITNAEASTLNLNPELDVFQIDLPKLMLDGAEVEHNARFIAEFVEGNKARFINRNKENLTNLNESALKQQSFEGDLHIRLDVDGDVIVSSVGKELVIEELDNKGEKSAKILFDNRMRPTFAVKPTYISMVEPTKGRNLILSVNKKRITAVLRQGKQTVSFKEETGELTITKEEIGYLSRLSEFLGSTVQAFPQEPRYRSLYENDMIRITSTSFGLQGIQTPTEILIGPHSRPTDRGINILTRANGKYSVQNFDTYAKPDVAAALLDNIELLQKEKAFFVLVAQFTVGETLLPYQDRLSALGFPVLGSLPLNRAYIGYADLGYVSEYKHKQSLSLSFPYYPPARLRSPADIHQQAKDPSRFIAHGGGKIDGYTYTNSLEALNESYKKGFRMFELDIIETFDGEFVAAHDWYSWKRYTGYKYLPPVSLAEFKKHKIRKKYTPMDMAAINKWFASHPDAILVTDKINSPKRFAEKFVDKNRLMMELFTMRGVQQGLNVGIKSAMPSMNVLNAIKGDKAAKLKEMGVKHVAVSLDLVEKNLPLFQSLKDNGIHTYVFHVNGKPWRDETYVLLHQMDHVYGMYADEWDFEE